MNRKTSLSGLAIGLSAVLTWAAFAPLSESANIAIALAPMLIIARTASAKRAAIAFLIFGFVHWFASLAWMPAIIKNNGPWPLVIAGWAGLALLCALYEALFGYLTANLWNISRGKGLTAFLAASLGEAVLWAGLEHCRAFWFTGFSWNELGSAIVDAPLLAGTARYIGIRGLSALIILVNGVFATVFLHAFRINLSGATMRISRTAETAIPLLSILLAITAVRYAATGTGEMVPVKVALVQQNAPCIFSGAAAKRNPFAEIKALVSQDEVQGCDLIVLAESAFTGMGPLDGRYAIAAAGELLKASGAYALLVGGDMADENEAGQRRYYNSAALYLTSDGGAKFAGSYSKQHLVPFGEYIPFDKKFKVLQRLSPIGVSLHPGKSEVLDMGGVGIAPLICFEDTDSSLFAKAATAKYREPYIEANAIVLITNDSWFSNSNEAIAHAAQARGRAVETGLPVIRVGNSGVTGIIDPDGRTRWLMDGDKPRVDKPGVMVDYVLMPRNPEVTFYSLFGDLPLLGLFAIAAIAALISPVASLLRRESTSPSR